MPTVDDIRQQLTQAVTELTSRGFQTTDPRSSSRSTSRSYRSISRSGG